MNHRKDQNNKQQHNTSQGPDHSLQESEQSNRSYTPPQMLTEDLLAFGAVCNGAATGGRKHTTSAPNFCNASRLLS